MKSYSFAIISCMFTLFITPATMATPDLQSDTELATAGYYQLRWQHAENASAGNFILEEATDSEFSNPTTLYQGPDTARLISGRPDGTYYYRIRNAKDTATTDAWSKVTTVEVAHHPLSRAFMFFTLGAIVFIATLTIVVIGNKKHS